MGAQAWYNGRRFQRPVVGIPRTSTSTTSRSCLRSITVRSQTTTTTPRPGISSTTSSTTYFFIYWYICPAICAQQDSDHDDLNNLFVGGSVMMAVMTHGVSTNHTQHCDTTLHAGPGPVVSSFEVHEVLCRVETSKFKALRLRAIMMWSSTRNSYADPSLPSTRLPGYPGPYPGMTVCTTG
eukprot:1050038-Rhodomonas_salina.2